MKLQEYTNIYLYIFIYLLYILCIYNKLYI